MSRLFLIACFSLTSVFGPLTCCCNAKAAVSKVAESPCCHGQADSAPLHHEHHEHDGRECPCGRHHASVLSAAVTETVHVHAVDMQIQHWLVPSIVTPTVAQLDGDAASLVAHSIPNALFGRAMLRAYQVMRC